MIREWNLLIFSILLCFQHSNYQHSIALKNDLLIEAFIQSHLKSSFGIRSIRVLTLNLFSSL